MGDPFSEIINNPESRWRVRVHDPEGLLEFERVGTLEAVEVGVLESHPGIEEHGWTYEIMPVEQL